MAHLAAVLPSHHSCLSETESRSPQSVVSWSPTAACPSTSIRFLPPVDPPQPPLRHQILHYRPERGGKWSLPRRP
ncbi:hypothetical protein FQA47_001134 [Oryzias melastigma]|uniref:Uncharacterized protein n=1 Tax=Oryzias melastigma TaxID=30732 RepID=A0A834F7F7_ORYME|nr:hypothetical protein FQA47_001134 [Oryzias melastigma]